MNPPINQTSQQVALGRAIRGLRQERGASLKTLASKAGITLNMLSLIERGEGNPTWATIGGIATALEISIAKLAQVAETFDE